MCARPLALSFALTRSRSHSQEARFAQHLAFQRKVLREQFPRESFTLFNMTDLALLFESEM
jgi:hypothetical protein